MSLSERLLGTSESRSRKIEEEISDLRVQQRYHLEEEKEIQIKNYLEPMLKKARQVTITFGEDNRSVTNAEYDYIFNFPDLQMRRIAVMDGDNSFEVNYKGQKVFSEDSRGIDCYVPGEWEGMIEELHPLAENARKNLEGASKRN